MLLAVHHFSINPHHYLHGRAGDMFGMLFVLGLVVVLFKNRGGGW